MGVNKSISNTYRVVYDTRAVTQAQMAAVLKELDKVGPGANEATVRGILRKLGVKPNLIVRIVPAGQRRGSEKIPMILLLMNPADEPAAMAVGDEGAPADKPKKPAK